jgi:hypothetical protein
MVQSDGALRCCWRNRVMKLDLALRTIAAVVCAAALTPAQAINNGINGTGFGSVGISGVQVAPDWVFTAQHVAPGVGQTFSNSFGSRTVAAVYTAPGSTGFPANDFALMRGDWFLTRGFGCGVVATPPHPPQQPHLFCPSTAALCPTASSPLGT